MIETGGELFLPEAGDIVLFWRMPGRSLPALVMETDYKVMYKPLSITYKCKVLADGDVYTILHPGLLEELPALTQAP